METQNLNFHEHTQRLKITPQNLVNKLWRVEHLYPIRDKQGRLVPFRLNKFQLKIAIQLMQNIVNRDYSPIVVLKARQVGISTFFCIWFLDDALWYEGVRAVVQSYKHETNQAIFNIATTAYQFMFNIDDHKTDDPAHTPNRLRSNEIDDRKGKISIPSLGSFLECKLDVRGTPTNRIHFSEYAFTEPERIMASLGSVSKEGVRVYESTPNGVNHFHTLYNEQKDKNPKNVFFFPWYEHREYQLPVPKGGLGPLSNDEKKLTQLVKLKPEQIQFWRHKEQEMRSIDENFSSFKQEFPSDDAGCFATSGGGLIDADILLELKIQTANTEPMETLWDGDTLVKRYKPRDIGNRLYGLYAGCDPAEGVGGDYSVCSVIRVTDEPHFEVLMSIRTKNDNPTRFVPKMVKYLRKHFSKDGEDMVQLCVERNGPGHSVLALLQENEECFYDCLYWHYQPSSGKPEKTFIPGFQTTNISRANILYRLANVCHEKRITLNDRPTASELQTLVRNPETGKIQHEVGCHDDCVFALALGIQAWSVNRPSDEPLVRG